MFQPTTQTARGLSNHSSYIVKSRISVLWAPVNIWLDPTLLSFLYVFLLDCSAFPRGSHFVSRFSGPGGEYFKASAAVGGLELFSVRVKGGQGPGVEAYLCIFQFLSHSLCDSHAVSL